MNSKFFHGLLLIIAFSAFCVAQGTKSDSDVPNFSGRWVSESLKDYSDRKSLDPDQKTELIVSQSATELRVKESTGGKRGSSSRDSIYYLDGRGESNKGFTDGFMYESKTVVKDKKLLIEAAVVLPKTNTKSNFAKNDEWELSADGKTLTIRTNNGVTPAGNSPPRFTVMAVRYEIVFRLVY